MHHQNKDLTNLLLKRKFFKLDLNEVDFDEKYIEKLLCIFILAGCSAIDINVQNQDINFLKNSINLALNNVNNLKEPMVWKPFIISSFYKQYLESKNLDLKKVISQAIIDGTTIIEFHLSEFTTQEAIKVLSRIQDFPAEIILSISISRKNHSNASIIEIIKYAKNIVGKNLIIEVESFSSSIKNNQFNETLQTLSTVDIINKQLKNKEIKYSKLPIIVAGSTNNQTSNLAYECGVKYNGITFGKYAISVLSKSIFCNIQSRNDELLLEINHIKNFIEKSFSI